MTRRLNANTTRHRGRVTWFDADEGYGFLACRHEADVFADTDAIERKSRHLLKAGDRVLFHIVETNVGVKASAVVKVCDATLQYRQKIEDCVRDRTDPAREPR